MNEAQKQLLNRLKDTGDRVWYDAATNTWAGRGTDAETILSVIAAGWLGDDQTDNHGAIYREINAAGLAALEAAG